MPLRMPLRRQFCVLHCGKRIFFSDHDLKLADSGLFFKLIADCDFSQNCSLKACTLFICYTNLIVTLGLIFGCHLPALDANQAPACEV